MPYTQPTEAHHRGPVNFYRHLSLKPHAYLWLYLLIIFKLHEARGQSDLYPEHAAQLVHHLTGAFLGIVLIQACVCGAVFAEMGLTDLGRHKLQLVYSEHRDPFLVLSGTRNVTRNRSQQACLRSGFCA